MPGDYFPAAESELVTWLNNFVAKLTPVATDYGLTTGELTGLGSTIGEWTTNYETNLAAQEAARVARQQKDLRKTAMFAAVRAMVARLQAHPAMNDIVRTQLGITVRDTIQSMSSSAAVAVARPIGKVDTSNRLQHVIDFRDSANQTKRGKPEGVRGCEIWLKVGERPTALEGNADPADMRFLALDTATPYAMYFNQADAGKTAYYALRWIANDATKGPWSETVESTIVG